MVPSAGAPAGNTAMDIAEFIVYDRVLSANERLLVEAYLDSKYALAVPPPASLFVVSHVPSGRVSAPISTIDLTLSADVVTGTFTTSDVALVGPTGPVVISSVMPLGSNVWRIQFSEQSLPGRYHARVGPQILGPGGRAMDQDQDGIAGEPRDDVYDASFFVQGVGTHRYMVVAAQTPPGGGGGAGSGIQRRGVQGTGPLEPWTTIPDALLFDPVGIAFNSRGELFVGNRTGKVSRMNFDDAGNFTVRETVTGNGLSWTHGVAISPSGELFAMNLTGSISRFRFALRASCLSVRIIPEG